MTLYQFKLLNVTDQAILLWGDGEMIAERYQSCYKYMLYQLYDFYTEVQFHLQQNTIVCIKSFYSADEPLNPYLEAINIDSIIESL